MKFKIAEIDWGKNRRDKERIQQLNHEIWWLQNQLETKVKSQKQHKEYLHQIKRKEITIAFIEKEMGKQNEI